jgi:hypothetical protein
MKAGFLALPAAFAAAPIGAPSFAQLAQKPVYPRQGVFGATVQMRSFESYRDFYASIAAERKLPDPDSDFAIQQIESRASVDHLRDYSGDPIVVVKLEQPNTPGQYSFYVMREAESRLRLLGQMNGYGYESSTARGHLEFVLDVRGRAATPSRYQVDGEFLIDLSDLASLDRNDPVELDVARGF